MTAPRLLHLAIATISTCVIVLACAGDEDRRRGSADGTGDPGLPPRGYENTGQACASPSECYPNVDPADLGGDVQCMDRVTDGYCTHLCTTDADCCAIDGECDTDLAQVCGPFESTGQNFCFLSCEDADVAEGKRLSASDEYIPPAGADDATEFCRRWAGIEFVCRSTGGGRDNRKVCVPGGGSCTNYAAQDDACKGCLVDSCCAEAAACDADPACRDLVACRRGCTTAACEDDCDAQHPGGVSVYRSLYYCMRTGCPVDCDYNTP